MAATQSISARSGELDQGLLHASAPALTVVTSLACDTLLARSATRTGLACMVFLCALLPAAGVAQLVDCTNPNNLCTGDPCMIPTVDVQSPCIADFGTRDLIIDGRITIPDGGVVDFKADTIDVRGRVAGANPNASQVTLTANQDITVTARVDVSGRTASGALVLDAGGNISLDRRIIARTRGAGTAAGGSVTITADGALTASKRVKIDVRGRRNHTNGGAVTLNGANGVTLIGQVDARGSNGGMIIIASTTGNVALEHKVRVEGDPGNGGKVLISASGTISNSNKGRITAQGEVNGGCVSLTGNAGVLVNQRLRADGSNGLGGVVVITATSGSIANERRIDADGDPLGGCVTLTASGSVTIGNELDAHSRGTGGLIVVAAGADVTVDDSRDLDADGNVAAGIIDLSGVNLTLPGDFSARGSSGGLIEGEASGNLTTADGTFRVDPGGSIQLCAGGTLDLSGDFDVPPGSSCTASPPPCPLLTCP